MENNLPPSPAPAAKPKRWPVGLLVGLVTGIAAAALAAPISDAVMQAHHVSNMEGGRGCAVVLCMMLALVGGCVIGFAVSLILAGTGFVGFLKRQGVSLLVIAVLIGAIGGIAWASADHPPLLDGKGLALEIQVRVPAKGRSVADLRALDFDTALVVSASDRSYSDMRWSDATEADGFIIVPAWSWLNSRNAGREITAGVKDENRQIFNVMLPAAPKKIDEQWSEWAAPRQRFDGSKPPLEDQYNVRYRVRFADEYSPTPSPTATPDPNATPTPPEESTPNESATPGEE